MNRFRCTVLTLTIAACALPLLPLSATPRVKAAPEAAVTREDESILPADRLETKLGTLEIETDPGEDYVFWATLDGERLVKLEGDHAAISAHLAQGARDVILVETGSGGIACPLMYRLVDLRPKQAPVVSEELGSCAEWDDIAFEGTKVVVRMPAYIPHPDLLTKTEVRRREKTTHVYTWDKGAVQEKAVVRK